MILANQIVTREWWRDAEERFELVVSALVFEVAGDGGPQAARDRLVVLEPLTVLDATDESIALARALTQMHALPAGAAQDAAHIAIAVVNGVEYLATWNLRRIANPVAAFEQVCRDASYEPTKICTLANSWRRDMNTHKSDPIVAEIRDSRQAGSAFRERSGSDHQACSVIAKGIRAELRPVCRSSS